MATAILDNIGAGKGLLPDGTKPLPETMLTYPQMGFVVVLRTVSQEMIKVSIQDISLKNTFWKLFPNLPGASELKAYPLCQSITALSHLFILWLFRVEYVPWPSIDRYIWGTKCFSRII